MERIPELKAFILGNWKMLTLLLSNCPNDHHLLVAIKHNDLKTPVFYFEKHSMGEYPNLICFSPMTEKKDRKKTSFDFFIELHKVFGESLTLNEFLDFYYQ